MTLYFFFHLSTVMFHVGVGSGFNIRMANKTLFDLITLYSATQKVRENSNPEARLASSKFLINNSLREDSPVEYEPNPSVKELCKTVDGFVYVIDASENLDQCGMCDHFCFIIFK